MPRDIMGITVTQCTVAKENAIIKEQLDDTMQLIKNGDYYAAITQINEFLGKYKARDDDCKEQGPENDDTDICHGRSCDTGNCIGSNIYDERQIPSRGD